VLYKLTYSIIYSSQHVKMVYVCNFRDFCPRLFPQGSFDESQRNGIWALGWQISDLVWYVVIGSQYEAVYGITSWLHNPHASRRRCSRPDGISIAASTSSSSQHARPVKRRTTVRCRPRHWIHQKLATNKWVKICNWLCIIWWDFTSQTNS